jgi:hypothetical protein
MANWRFAQLAAWNGELIVAVAPWWLVRVLEMLMGSQLVGSSMNLGRSM